MVYISQRMHDESLATLVKRGRLTTKEGRLTFEEIGWEAERSSQASGAKGCMIPQRC